MLSPLEKHAEEPMSVKGITHRCEWQIRNGPKLLAN